MDKSQWNRNLLDELFLLYDKNKSNKLEFNEAKSLIKDFLYQAKSKQSEKDVVAKIIQFMDTNNDSCIDKEELASYLNLE